MKKILIALLLCALSLSAASGLAEGKLEAIQAAGKLVMGTDAAWPPFEYRSPRSARTPWTSPFPTPSRSSTSS